MKIIDAHIHYNKEPYFNQIAALAGHENSEKHLQHIYKEHNIVHGVVMGNRDLDLEFHQYPDFLSYCVGLDSSYFKGDNIYNSIGLVEEHLKRGTCVGIKLYPGYNPYYVNDPVYHPFYDLAQRYDKPVAIHTGATASSNALLRYSHPLTIDEVAVAYPKVQFVMCHLGNPWIVDAVAVLSKNKNVAADLSGILEGIVSIPEFLQQNWGYLEQIKTWLSYLNSYDRLLYGTDWPLANIANYIQLVSHLIPERHQEQVFFKNARRIYGLQI